jgi:hypothetical protein
MHDLVLTELARKGYLEAGSSADFLVGLSSGTAKELKKQPATTYGANADDPPWITAGEIVVDAFDRSTGQQVWHGTAEAEVDPQEINGPQLEAAVQQMLAPFPTHVDAPAQR